MPIYFPLFIIFYIYSFARRDGPLFPFFSGTVSLCSWFNTPFSGLIYHLSFIKFIIRVKDASAKCSMVHLAYFGCWDYLKEVNWHWRLLGFGSQMGAGLLFGAPG